MCVQSNVVPPIDHNTTNNIDKVASINKQFVYQSHFVMNVVLTVYGILLLVSLDEGPEVVPSGPEVSSFDGNRAYTYSP